MGVIDDPVEQFAELGLDGGVLQADHAAVEQLRLQSDLVCCAHDADGFGRCGGEVDVIRIACLDAAYDRREIDGVGRIAAIVEALMRRTDTRKLVCAYPCCDRG